jgi:tetratricopeptide (TPR) repeat protein
MPSSFTGRLLLGLGLAAALGAPACQHRHAPPSDLPVSPMSEKARLDAEEWARATKGLDLERKDGRVGVVRIHAGDPLAARQHAGRGDALMAENRIMEGLEQYALALRHDPDLAPAYVGLGVVLQRKGRLPQAVASYRTALDRDPLHADARYRLAVALWAQGEQEQAVAELQTLLGQDQDSARAHERLAVWSYYREDFPAAWHHLHRAASLGERVPAQLESLLATRMPDPGP